jgi:hypothetical protein
MSFRYFKLFQLPSFVLFFVSFFLKTSSAQDSLSVVAEGEFRRMIASQKADSFAVVKESVLMAQANAIESTFGKVLMQKTSLDISTTNVNDRVTSNESFKMSAESNLTGRWVKDITPPIVAYYTRNKELWISVKVKGYVREIKPKSFNEDREAMANYVKQLYLNSPFSDITIVENYNSKFLVSIVALDKANYKSLSDMNRVASIKAKAQVSRYFNGAMSEEIYIIQTTPQSAAISGIAQSLSAIKETSSGWVNSLDLLTTFPAEEDQQKVFVYSKLLENIK